jgi:plastocyanin
VTIRPGGTVTFSWSGGAVHDLSVPGLGFSEGAKETGNYTLTFTNAGNYPFACVVHPQMRGIVNVQ